MDVQHQIRRQLTHPGSVRRIVGLLAAGDIPHRTALAARSCADFGFLDPRGRPQVATCMSALRALEGSGQIELPARRTSGGTCVRKRHPATVAPPRDVPAEVGQVRGLMLVPVANRAHREIWQGLMEYEHPRGAGPLLGRQLRYLLWSEHGWLGAIGIAASVLHLAARDRWIGRDAEMRRAHGHRGVGLSRFLIRRCVAAIWPRMCSAASCVASPPNSPHAMASSHGSSRPSSSHPTTAPVCARPTGGAWARPRAAAGRTVATMWRPDAGSSMCMNWRRIGTAVW